MKRFLLGISLIGLISGGVLVSHASHQQNQFADIPGHHSIDDSENYDIPGHHSVEESDIPGHHNQG
ncbi:hypothetical protein [Oceanobacillus sp. CFH 90083]|uniref:hypothetical protein n=1 Tax=Oceanobacillus sp. CFH 90083 TaxID=2592336 RepID=UPI00128BCE83|nr:hypothetical protein [Oceanobacillus sp. CFH 90083]